MIDCEKDLILDSILRTLSKKAFQFIIQTDLKSSSDFFLFSANSLKMFGASQNIIQEILRVQAKYIQKENKQSSTISDPIPTLVESKEAFRDQNKETKEEFRHGLVLNHYNGRVIDNYNNFLPKPINELIIKDWSILNHSISSFMRKQLNRQEDFDDLTRFQETKIIDLGLTRNNARILRFHGFLLDDPLEYLLNLTMIKLLYLGLEESFYDRLFSFVLNLDLLNIDKYYEESTRESTIIIDSISDEAILKLQFQIPKDLGLKIDSSLKSRIVIKQIIGISEYNIIRRYNLNYKSLTVLLYFWMISNEIDLIRNEFENSLSLYSFSSIIEYLSECVNRICEGESDRNCEVFKMRIGLYDNEKLTLQQISDRQGLTRERIRQILSKCTRHIASSKTLAIFNHLNYSMLECANMSGGVITLAEFIEEVYNDSSAAGQNSIQELTYYVKFPRFLIQDNLIINESHRCLHCIEMMTYLGDKINKCEQEIYTKKEVKKLLEEFCEHRKCIRYDSIIQFSDGFLQYIEIKDVGKDEELNFFSSEKFAFYNASVAEKVELIVKEELKPVHYLEVFRKFSEREPGFSNSKQSIYNALQNNSNIFLWGKGIFLHRELVSLEEEIFQKIEFFLIQKLDEDIPFFYIHGAFRSFKQQLKNIQVPNVQALYSCLKYRDNEQLKFNDYPYVTRMNSTYIRRLPVQQVISEYIEINGGPVKKSMLAEYSITCLGMTEQIVTSSVLPNLIDIIRYSKNEFIHIQNVTITKQALYPIYTYVDQVIESFTHISISKIFRDKRVTCASIGISNPIYLYYLLKYYYSDGLSFNNYPQVSNYNVESITVQIVKFIKEKNAPCSFQELKKHFSTNLGYSENTIAMVKANPYIVRYSKTALIHLDSINWTEEKETQFFDLVKEYLGNIQDSGKLYGKISDFFNLYINILPEIKPFEWTSSIIAEILAVKCQIIGSNKEAFFLKEKQNNIRCFEDLVYHILLDEFEGAANLEDFRLRLVNDGVITNKLTKIMLKPGEKVEIVDNVIKIKGYELKC